MINFRKQSSRFSTLTIGVLLVLSFSCDDFLDESPDNRVALDDLENASQLLVNAYSIASPNFTDWMSDDVQFTTGTNLRLSHEQIYNWEDVNTGPTDQDTPDFYWFQTYQAISHANEVLAVIDGLPSNSGEEEARKNAIEAEARLTRAYGHFMLVNLFGQAYNVSSNLAGVPYVDEPETTFLARYERESVRRVYDKIEDDLLIGLDLVDDSFYQNSGKYHFNRNAALAFATRFYLFKADFIRCLQYSNELLGNSPSTFVRDLTSQEFRAAGSSVTEYPRLYTSPDQPANLLLMRKISLFQRTDFAYGPERDFYSGLYGTHPFSTATDERENPAFVKGFNSVFPVRYQGLFERLSLNSNVGTPYYIHIGFSGEEVLLNRAEANLYSNNLGEVIADLQILSEKRFSDNPETLTLELLRDFYSSSLTDSDILLNYILFERRKEFLMQGMRWFDIKRYGFSVVHDFPGGSTQELVSDDRRKILQIPSSAQEVGGLSPNPR